MRNEAYQADKIEEQLEEQAFEFFGDTTKNSISGDKVYLSKIFQWFHRDFTNNGTIQTYISKYMRGVHPNTSIRYKPYDWRLNEKKQ